MRFDAIAVGVTLALRENAAITPVNVVDWLESAEFKQHTTSGSANNRSKVTGRIDYVKNMLLN